MDWRTYFLSSTRNYFYFYEKMLKRTLKCFLLIDKKLSVIDGYEHKNFSQFEKNGKFSKTKYIENSKLNLSVLIYIYSILHLWTFRHAWSQCLPPV